MSVDLGKRVQLGGQTYAIEKSLVGLERELRVDMSNDSLRLHDGSKIGGYEFLNRDQSIALFQRRQLELDGFAFGAQEKGLLVRVGPSSYKIRQVKVNTDQMDITNPRGTVGDIYITLLETIVSDHAFTGTITFTEAIQAQGGVVGDVTGNLTGNVTGNLTGNTTGTHTGNVDVRGADFITDAGQIVEEQIDPQLIIDRGVPYGAIVMWGGDLGDIPESWALCDGDNGTPDLRDRFVVAAGGDFDAHDIGGTSSEEVVGETGVAGSHTHTLNIAGHALTISELPPHHHNIPNGEDGDSAAGPEGGEGGSEFSYPSGDTGGGLEHTHTGSTAVANGDHTHSITLDRDLVKPPYYALCYIMKIV